VGETCLKILNKTWKMRVIQLRKEMKDKHSRQRRQRVQRLWLGAGLVQEQKGSGEMMCSERQETARGGCSQT
jgi:hypothetical protein